MTRQTDNREATAGEAPRVRALGGRRSGLGGGLDILIPAAIIAVILAVIAATRSEELLRRPLWLDEIHTALLVDDPSFTHAMQALSRGADYNPPTLFLMTRGFAWVAGSKSELALRSAGFISVLLATLGVYALVRRVYPPLVALTAAAATWAHPLALHHMFDARFYGPWLAAIVWFAYSLNAQERKVGRYWPKALVAVTSFLVCTIHYFGIISLILVAVTHAFFNYKSLKLFILQAIPILLGPVALSCCVPLYFGQKASLSVPTWIKKPNFDQLWSFVGFTYAFYMSFIIIITHFLSAITKPEDGRGATKELVARDSVRELSGLGSLSLMPAIICVFTLVVQPAHEPRYAIPAIASIGALMAPIVARSRRPFQALAIALLLITGVARLTREVNKSRNDAEVRRSSMEALAGLRGSPVLFRNRLQLGEFWWNGPDDRGSWYLWDPAEIPGLPTNLDLVQRDVANVQHKWYGLPEVQTIASQSRSGRFYLFGFEDSEVARIREKHANLKLGLINRKYGIYNVLNKNRE